MKIKFVSFILGLGVVIGILYFAPDNIFQFVIILVGCITFFEFISMFEQDSKLNLLLMSIFLVQRLVVFFIDSKSYILLPLLYLFLFDFNENEKVLSQLLIFVGFFYIGVLPDNFYQISLLNNGRILLVLLVCTTWARDLGAYLTGLFLITNHPIIKRINSKKTYEGAIIGGVFAFVTVTLFNNHFSVIDQVQSIWLTVIITVTGQIGDLTGSKFKRLAGKKDSSAIIPGQGGFLDKLDGLIFTSTSFLVLLILQ